MLLGLFTVLFGFVILLLCYFSGVLLILCCFLLFYCCVVLNCDVVGSCGVGIIPGCYFGFGYLWCFVGSVVALRFCWAVLLLLLFYFDDSAVLVALFVLWLVLLFCVF